MFGAYRTVLALLVVAQHLGGAPVIGGYAVFGFYILSGYLMTLIMHQSYGYTAAGIRNYALNRFLRIYPSYWVSIGLSLVLVLWLGEEQTRSYHKLFFLPQESFGWLRNIAVFFPFREAPRLTPPAWALTVEIFFYGCLGLGLSRSRRVVLGWFLLSVLYHLAAVVLGLSWEQKYFTLPAASLPFASGALLYHYRVEAQNALGRVLGDWDDMAPWLFLGLIFGNWFVGLLTGQLLGICFYSNLLLQAMTIASLQGCRRLAWLSRGLDKRLGDLSYPIYLLHYQIGLLTVCGLTSAGISWERPDPRLFFVSLPLVLLGSWLLARVIEQPLEYLRQQVKSRQRPVAYATA